MRLLFEMREKEQSFNFVSWGQRDIPRKELMGWLNEYFVKLRSVS